MSAVASALEADRDDRILILPVVVVYNQTCEASASCRSLLDSGARGVTVVDNSTRPMGNPDFCRAHLWTHIDMGGNTGLSRAYNTALSRLPDRIAGAGTQGGTFSAERTLLLWLDDDTTLPSGFLEILAVEVAAHPDADVFLPVVDDAASILSPSHAGRLNPRRLRGLDELPADGRLTPEMGFTAINSGMAVRSSVYADRRYDEGFFLDFLDHDFLRGLRAAGIRFQVLPVHIGQRFSDTTPSSTEAAATRFRIFCKDYRRYQHKAEGPVRRLAAEMYLFFRAGKLGLRHRSLVFLQAMTSKGDAARR